MEEIKKIIHRMGYSPILNDKEYERICKVNNADDYFLKMRADLICNHMRLFRVYRNKALKDEKNWSLEKSFSLKPYEMFLTSIDEELEEKCQKVAYGNSFSTDPNGYILATEYGPILTINESLEYFFKYMNLALLTHKEDIPEHIRLNALRIAIRIMLQTESLDFFMDPRGIIPKNIEKSINRVSDYQFMFIAGHEFSHYLLGHLDDKDTSIKPIYYNIFNNEEKNSTQKIYNSSQKIELEADLEALRLPQLNIHEYQYLFEGTLIWFFSLELFEFANEIISPSNPYAYKTHPSARDRIDNILENAEKPNDFSEETWNNFKKIVNDYKEFLREDISVNFDTYEMYGSLYLDEPNTKWRGKKLIDRVDYY